MDLKHDPYSYHLHSIFAQLLALIRRGHYDGITEVILAEPAVLKLRDRMGRCALHHCADSFPVATSSSVRPNITADVGQLLIRMVPSMVEWQDNEGNIALHLAVINGDQALVRQLLRAMSVGQINIADYELHTAIHWSVVSGQLDTMTMALDHGADPSTPDIYGAYPIHYATQNYLESFTMPGASITRQSHLSHNLQTELATTHPQRPVLPNILNNNNAKYANISSKRRAKSLRILHQLLTRPQIDVNCIDNEQRTPLIWAASSGNHDALLVLVKAGAEISQQDKDGLSALHCASSRGHYRCVDTLITMCGADVHQLDSGGCTPLFYAVALGHPDCVRLLIKSGAKLDHQDQKGRTAAHCGASKGQLETLKILHENGANLWLKNVRGDLPLHEAVKSGRVDLVKWLLDQSPKSVNEVNLYGRSPMHIAAFNHNLEMCRLLASYGADMNPVMKIRSQYLTPLDAAMQNGSAHDELIEFLRQQGAQSITQIDHQLAEYMRKENDKQQQQNLNLTETEEEFNKFNVSRKMSSLRQQASANIDVGFSGITKGRSRSKPRDVRISDHPTMEDVKPRKSKSKPARFKVDVEPQIFADASATTKLPNLVTNGSGQKRAVSSSKSGSSSPLSSSPPNSVVHSATAHAHHAHHHHQQQHQYTDRVKNVREFETIIDGGSSQGQNGSHKHHATHLKQAIITNVYLTAPAAAISTLAPVESTGAQQLTTAGTAALLPVYYVKRVPPLKKLSTSSSTVGVGHKRMKKLNGKGKKPPRGVVSVLLETHDTYESGGRVSEQRISKQEELDLKNRTDSLEQEADDDGEEQEEEGEEGEDVEQEKDGAIEREDTDLDSQHRTEEGEAKEGDLVDSLAVEREPAMMEERTPDSGFETEAMNRKESLKDFHQHRKESFKSDLQDRTSENQSDQKDQKEDSQSSASSEDEDEKIQKKNKKKDSSSSSSSSDEDESKIEKHPKDSAGWLGSRLEEMAKSTTKTINGTVGVVQDKLRFDSAGGDVGKKSIEDDDEDEERNKQIPEELIHRDFVQSFNKDEQDDDDQDDQDDDDERRKRSVQLEPVTEVHLKRQKSTDSLQSVKSATAAASFDDQAEPSEDAGIDGEADRKAEEDDESLLIETIKDEPKKDQGEESSIVEVFDGEEASARLDDGQQQQHGILDKIDEVADQTIQQGIQTVAEVEENLEEKLSKLAHPPTDLPEVDETMVVKKEIKFKGFDYDDQEGDDTESKEQPPTPKPEDSTGVISGDISGTLKQEGARLLDKVDEKLENMESALGLKHRKSIDGEEEEDGQASKQETDDETEASHVKQQQADSEAEPSAPTEEHEEQEEEDHGADQQEPPDPDSMMVPVQRIRRGSYTKRSSLLAAEDPNTVQGASVVEEGPNLKGESGGLDSSQENLHVNPSSPAFASSFGPVRQLKGKKKSYDHVRPKVNSYWSDEYHHQHPRKDRSPGSMVTGKHHGRYPHDDKHHHYHQYGSMGYLATTSNDDYARIDPKVINQTVEKYLRKYYLERQLFEELYDLKRYQIRTGKTNEPQSVKRLVDRFRREVKAPGMADFQGPYTYRAFEMYLYDLLRHLSRSNQRKIAYLTKSISYEDLASSFERLQAEAEAEATGSSDEFRRSRRRHARDHNDDRYYRYKLHSDLSSEETSDMAGGQHGDSGDGGGGGGGGENRQSATTRHRSKFDPLTDYDRQPLGLVVDYKYEYHKSQHRAGHGHSGELVDVILENLYKRTGMHGNKMDEMAVSRKIVERSGNEDNDGDDDDDGHGGGHGDGGADDKHLKPESRKSTKRHGADGAGVANEVWPDNDRNYRSYSRCSVYGHPGPSTTTTNDNSLNIKLARLSRTRQQPSRKRRFVRKKHQISIPMDQIRQRWHRIKRFERERHRNLLRQNDTSSSSPVDSDFTLWFELNQKWRPRIEILEPY